MRKFWRCAPVPNRQHSPDFRYNRQMRIFLKLTLLALVVALPGCGRGLSGASSGDEAPPGAAALPPALDDTFGSDGVVRLAVSTQTRATGIALQSDGKILASVDFSDGTEAGIGLVRFNSDGTRDTGFGSGGLSELNAPANSESGSAMALLANGSIHLAGTNGESQKDFVISRNTEAGARDNTFAGTGERLYGGAPDEIYSGLAIFPGQTLHVGTSQGSFIFTTLDDIGNVVLEGGVAFPSTSGVISRAVARAGADGAILVGEGTTSGAQTEILAARIFPSTAQLDPAFGDSGRVMFGNSGNDGVSSVAVEAGGNYLISGFALIGEMETFQVVRLSPNGGVDSSFGREGYFHLSAAHGTSRANALVIDASSKIYAAGVTSSEEDPGKLMVARITASGVLDTTFGDGGVVKVNLSTGVDTAAGIALQSDGKIVVVGTSQPDGGAPVLVLVRLDP